MYLGRPCHFLKIGQGCTIYSDRPQEPCRRYECAWISDTDIPDFMKPEISNCVLDYKEDDNGVRYLRLVESETPYTEEVLDWCKNYAKEKNIDFVWVKNKKSYRVVNSVL